jgi:hypothetical protein
MLKAVIDTNLLIDGSVDDYNYGNRIIDAVLDGRIEAYANRATINENKLLSHKKISDEAYLQKLEDFFKKIKSVVPQEKLDVVEDKEDNKLVESAVAASADYLISSDNHLLKLGSYGKTRMVNPSQFVAIMEEEIGEGWGKWVDEFMK